MAGTEVGLVLTALLLGLRHGLDWDHIAAIADIAGSVEDPKRSVWFSSLYALGHAAVVFVLGVAAIAAGDLVPASLDVVMERAVGLTLVALGLYVFYALMRDRRGFRFRSRWTLVAWGVSVGVARLRRALRGEPRELVILHDHDHDHGDGRHAHHHSQGTSAHETRGGSPAPDDRVRGARSAPPTALGLGHRHPHVHRAPAPEDPFLAYGRLTSAAIGALHGVGAETPTQVLLFLAAAGADDAVTGIALLVAFLTGLVTCNTLVALAASFGFLQAERNFALYAGLALVAGTVSLGLGLLYLLGWGSILPPLLAG